MPFTIDKKFLKSSYHITDLKLCSIRLHDNLKFPWLILIPRRKNITDMSELNSKDQILLMKEIIYVSKIVKKLFKTSKLNIEKIGNAFYTSSRAEIRLTVYRSLYIRMLDQLVGLASIERANLKFRVHSSL